MRRPPLSVKSETSVGTVIPSTEEILEDSELIDSVVSVSIEDKSDTALLILSTIELSEDTLPSSSIDILVTKDESLYVDELACDKDILILEITSLSELSPEILAVSSSLIRVASELMSVVWSNDVKSIDTVEPKESVNIRLLPESEGVTT